MKKIISTVTLILSTLILSAQTIIGNQLAIQVKTEPNSGSSQYALVSLPDNYDKETDKYPLLLFFHGAGELGKTITDLSKLNNQGLPNLISKGLKVQAVNPIDKKNYKFIVVSPQHHGWTTTANSLEFIIKQLANLYRVDTTRVYLTGLSAGGQGVIQDVTYSQQLTNSIAAIVPMSPSSPSSEVLKNFTFFKESKTGAWFFSGASDPGIYTLNAKKYNDSVNKYYPGGSKVTIYPGGHCCWTTYYDPSYRENGMNIYEWMLQYTTTSSPSTTIPSTEPTDPVVETPPVEEDKPDTVSGNVSYKYYEGANSKLPDFSKLKPINSGTIKNFKLDVAKVKDNFSFLYEGYIKIDVAGSYTFGLNSDDGSKLFIDSLLVVDHDGLHSASYKEKAIDLTKGIHRIEVQYFEAGGDSKLEVFWKPIGKTTKELIPDAVLAQKPIVKPPTTGNPKEVGRFKFIDMEIILYDNLTWEYSEVLDLQN